MAPVYPQAIFFSSVLAAFATGLLVSYLWNPSPASVRRENTNKTFYLGVTITFPNEAEKKYFIELFRPLATYVEKFELGTISYTILDSDKQNNKVYILERYKSKEYYLSIHKSSPEFLSFREKLQQMVTKGAVIEGDSFLETGIGFI